MEIDEQQPDVEVKANNGAVRLILLEWTYCLTVFTGDGD